MSVVSQFRVSGGYSAAQLLTESLSHASGRADDPPVASLSDRLVSVGALALRAVQLYFIFEQLVACGGVPVLVLEVLSVALSALVLAMQLTMLESRLARILYGGSNWMTDALLALLFAATHFPLADTELISGFSAIARVAVGSVLIGTVLPRLVTNAGAVLSCADSPNATSAFRSMSKVAVAAYCLQSALVAALTFQLLVRGVVHLSSGANQLFTATMLGVSVVALVFIGYTTLQIYTRARAAIVLV